MKVVISILNVSDSENFYYEDIKSFYHKVIEVKRNVSIDINNKLKDYFNSLEWQIDYEFKKNSKEIVLKTLKRQEYLSIELIESFLISFTHKNDTTDKIKDIFLELYPEFKNMVTEITKNNNLVIRCNLINQDYDFLIGCYAVDIGGGGPSDIVDMTCIPLKNSDINCQEIYSILNKPLRVDNPSFMKLYSTYPQFKYCFYSDPNSYFNSDWEHFHIAFFKNI